MTDVSSIQFAIQQPGDPAPSFILGVEPHAEAFATRQVGQRKLEVTSPWVGGTFTIRAVRDQVTEPVSLWVDGNTALYGGDTRSPQQRLQDVVEQLTNAFDQVAYKIALTIGNQVQTWDCSAAAYTIVTEQPYVQATLALVQAQVPRNPHVVRTTA